MIATNDKYAQANSKSGHKNISYQRQRDAYVVNVMRKGYIFVTLCKSVEEAIDIRDLVYEFFYKNDRLPSIEEMGLKNGSVLKAKIKSKRNDRESNYTCKICNRRFHYYEERLNGKNSASNFKERGDICGFCEFSINPTISTEISEHQRGRLNEKYVSVYTRPSGRSYYSVRIIKNHRQLSRSFLDLNDAIAFRDIVVEFYNTNGRLPSKDEQDILFPKCPTSKIVRDKTSNNSKRDGSSTGLDNISRRKDDGRYNVRVIRDNVSVVVTFKTLEEAITARELILEIYRKTGSLPSRGEVIANLIKHQSHSQGES